LLVVLSAVTEAKSKSLALRETTTSENGAAVYPTLIGTEEYPKVQSASAVLVTSPFVLPT